jgi:sensor histidine kinase regulating citrate/malate metabolism
LTVIPDLLHKAFQNLVLNALDAMPAGGTLTFRTAETQTGVRIEVSDTGKGLTPEGGLATLYAVLHDEAVGHRAGAGDCAIGDQRPSGTISVASEEGHWHELFASNYRNASPE